MKKLLNTLYVTSPDSWLHCDGENVVVKIGGEERFRMPFHNLESIISFGRAGASPALMSACASKNIGLSFMSEGGAFMARPELPMGMLSCGGGNTGLQIPAKRR